VEEKTRRVEIRSFLIGSLLGNCSVNIKNQWQWSEEDQNWAEWKAAFVRRTLKRACIIEEIKDPSSKTGYRYVFTACAKKGRLRVYRQWFCNHVRGKHISKKIQHFNHPTGLVILLMDLGCVHNNQVQIDLSAYSVEEAVLFQETIKENFNLDCSVKNLQLCFEGQQSVDLFTAIQNSIPKVEYVKKKLDGIFSLLY
jgi:hypothetical protein